MIGCEVTEVLDAEVTVATRIGWLTGRRCLPVNAQLGDLTVGFVLRVRILQES